MRQEAALLKDLKKTEKIERNQDSVAESSESDEAPETEAETSTREAPVKVQQCRFSAMSLGTTPSTPCGGQVSCRSPPGLSRQAMRELRDAFGQAQTITSKSWGSHAGAALVIDPAGKPVTPPALRRSTLSAAGQSTRMGQNKLDVANQKAHHAPR